MPFQSVLFRPVADFLDGLLRLNSSAPPIMGIFEAYELSSHHVFVFRPNQVSELVYLKHTAFASDRLRDQTRKLGECPLLVMIDVTVCFTKEFAASTTMYPEGDLIRHGAAGHEYGGFFA